MEEETPRPSFGALPHYRGFPGGQTVKNLSAMQKRVGSLDQGDPLEKGMTTHSSILAWRIPGQRGLAGYSPWGRKELDTTERLTLNYPTPTEGNWAGKLRRGN